MERTPSSQIIKPTKVLFMPVRTFGSESERNQCAVDRIVDALKEDVPLIIAPTNHCCYPIEELSQMGGRWRDVWENSKTQLFVTNSCYGESPDVRKLSYRNSSVEEWETPQALIAAAAEPRTLYRAIAQLTPDPFGDNYGKLQLLERLLLDT